MDPNSDAQYNPSRARVRLSEQQGHRCAYCGVECHTDWRGVQQSPTFATVDEVIPRAAGGPVVWGNQVMACCSCNEARGFLRALDFFSLILSHGRDEGYRIAEKMKKRLMYRWFGTCAPLKKNMKPHMKGYHWQEWERLDVSFTELE